MAHAQASRRKPVIDAPEEVRLRYSGVFWLSAALLSLATLLSVRADPSVVRAGDAPAAVQSSRHCSAEAEARQSRARQRRIFSRSSSTTWRDLTNSDSL